MGAGRAPIRVLHVVSHVDLRMGGSIVAAFQLAGVANGDDCACTVVGVIDAGGGTDAYFREWLPSLDLKVFPRHFPRRSYASLSMRRWLHRNVGRFQAVHLHGLFNFAYLFGGRAAVAAGVPLVVSPHGSLDPFDLKKRAWAKRYLYGPWMVGPLLSRTTAMLCTSPLEAERLVTYGARPDPPRVSIPLPVEPLEGMEDGGEWRRRHGIPPEDTVVLFLSRIDVKKGLDLLIPAFARVRREMGGVTLAIAGTGDAALEATLRELAAGEEAAGAVRWIGFVSGAERRAAYSGCDVFALPSYNENFGIVVVEAMHAGRAILISNEVYIHETLTRHGCAEVCETTVESVTACLRRLVADRERREAMGARARDAAVAEFGPDTVRERLRDLYRRAAKAGVRGR